MTRLVKLLMVIVATSLMVTVLTMPKGVREGPGTQRHEIIQSTRRSVIAVPITEVGGSSDIPNNFQALGFKSEKCADDDSEALRTVTTEGVEECLELCKERRKCKWVVWKDKESACIMLARCSAGMAFRKETKGPQGPSLTIKSHSDLKTAVWVTIQNIKHKNYVSLPYDTNPAGRAIKLVPHETHAVAGWAFQTVLGTYVSAEGNGFLSADRRKPRSMEHFTIEFIGKPTDTGDVAIIRCTKSRKLVLGNKNMKMQSRVATQDDSATHFVIKRTDPPGPDTVLKQNRDHNVCKHIETLAGDPLLLFTSPKPVQDAYSERHAMVLSNWKRLPCFTPLIISDHTNTLAVSAEHNVETDNRLEIQDKYSQPTYRGLFATAFKHSEARYAMYSNSDIMYSTNLAETVEAVLKFKAAGTYKDAPLLLVGQRTNVAVDDDWEMRGDNWYEAVEELEKKGKLFQPDAEDFFFASKDLAKWKDMPDFVVGGAAFDNWFVAKSVKTSNALTVDVTRTVTAVHMDHETHRACGSKCSLSTPKSAYNTKLANSHGGTARGTTGDCEYATVRTLKGIQILKRDQFYI